MFTLPETKFDFVGDDYIYAEISPEMSEDSNFKALAITNELRKRDLPGVLEICPSNASYLVQFNPEVISARDLLESLKEIDMTKSNPSELNLEIRVIEIPIWYDDPYTEEYSKKYRERNVIKDDISNFNLVMKVNGYTDKKSFIEAHSSHPYLLTMMGFIPGTVWEYPLGLEKKDVLQAPKYISPRTNTPSRAVGVGGAFTVIYPFMTPGSYQLIGLSAVPLVDHEQKLAVFNDSVFLAKPGDIWKHRPVSEGDYMNIRKQVKQGTYQYKIKELHFSPEEYFAKRKSYIQKLMEGF
ncbi:5-oxoprolinase subunit B family protein [Halalkalibacterium ligniniphilum]|uniref:5-oxoprolinase subunit B family protein n=1 Tax=Halalkalibacterium ligniniphilum TaxID=1134413 RepID=UPI00034AD3EA|nr:carboxyltransferase domain-containing protein [Halalkalibacterium ligniniphilum]